MSARTGLVLIFLAALLMVVAAVSTPAEQDSTLAELRAKYSKKETPSVDHTQFAILKQKFAKPQDVTAACISCHNQRHKEVMQSTHWNWGRIEYIPGKGIRRLGKRNVLNNFCIGVSGNEQSCAKCHIGYGLDGP